MTTLRRRAALAAALALPAFGLASPAAADDDRCRGPITAERAIEIARRAGMVRVTEVECDDGAWEIEGRDARGREMEVEIDPRTGRILDIEYD
ncbi:MAG: PepSY domain-containing protein [Acetobacteraceae bacterium]